MELVRELKEVERNVLATASRKERAFYEYLIGSPWSFPEEKGVAHNELVCFGAFCKDPPDVQDSLYAMTRENPIKGIHYSKNTIELFAAAVHRPEAERRNVVRHCEERGWKVTLLFRRIYPDLGLGSGECQDWGDTLAWHVMNGAVPDQWPSIFLCAAKKVSDVVDMYILHSFCVKVIEGHPFTKRWRSAQKLATQLQKFMERCERRVRIYVRCGIVLAACGLVAGALYLATYHWGVMEPLLAIISLSGATLVFLWAVWFGDVPDRVKVIRGFERAAVEAYFRHLGLQKREIEGLVEMLEVSSEDPGWGE